MHRGDRPLEGEQAQQHHGQGGIFVGRQAQFTTAMQTQAVQQLGLIGRQGPGQIRNLDLLWVSLIRLADGRVSFAYKDYSQGGRAREMTLPVEEFIRRFLLHVLPESFVRIRYFGLLSNRHRKGNLARCREWLKAHPVPETGISAALAPEDWRARLTRLTGRDPTVCLVCGQGHLRLVEELPAVPFDRPGRSPP